MLQVKNLTATYSRRGIAFDVLGDVSLDLHRREILGVVGESGSGKSTLGLVLMGLHREAGASIVAGSVNLDGRDILKLPDDSLRELRRDRLGLIVQDPHASLNPAFTIRSQLTETNRWRKDLTRDERRTVGLDALSQVRLPSVKEIWRSYPHELSGGMKQRVVAAMATMNNPAVLVADEPTTALDLTTQAQFLSLLLHLRDNFNLSIVIITHDLGVVAEVCDTVAVMYGGRIVEVAPVHNLFDGAAHPYTRGLLAVRAAGRSYIDGGRIDQIAGQPPLMWDLPAGCSFAPRCDWMQPDCRRLGAGSLVEIKPGHFVECRVAVDREVFS